MDCLNEYDPFILNGWKEKLLRTVFYDLLSDWEADPIELPQPFRKSVEAAFKETWQDSESGLWHRGFEGVVDAFLERTNQPEAVGAFQCGIQQCPADSRICRIEFTRHIAREIIELAISKGDIICVGKTSDIVSLIPRQEYEREEFGIHLPAELDPYTDQMCDEYWLSHLDENELWFAFTRDLSEVLDAYDATSSSPRAKPQKKGKYATRDAPFVQLAIEMRKSGEAANAHEAVVLITHGRWKDVAPEANSFSEAVAGNAADTSKSKRLYNQVNDEMKKIIQLYEN